MKYVIGNWKSNKSQSEASEWMKSFLEHDFTPLQDKVTFVVCPPFPLLATLAHSAGQLNNVKIGAQDVSEHVSGPYTGDVAAVSLQGLADYVLIGHSERRANHHETDSQLLNKTKHAMAAQLTPVYCIRSTDDPMPDGVRFVAYEPVHAIGTGNNEPLDAILTVKETLTLPERAVFIYGGSVNSKNARDYLSHNEIDGVLPGGSSLDAEEFFSIGLACL